MTERTSTALYMVSGLALLVSLVGIAGCQKDGGAGSLPKAQGNSAVALGRTVFAANNCVKCHSVGGQGGRMGPDLTHVGAKPGHTYDWFMVKVRNPRAINPASKMPAFGREKISDKDLVALAGYLVGLK